MFCSWMDGNQVEIFWRNSMWCGRVSTIVKVIENFFMAFVQMDLFKSIIWKRKLVLGNFGFIFEYNDSINKIEIKRCFWARRSSINKSILLKDENTKMNPGPSTIFNRKRMITNSNLCWPHWGRKFYYGTKCLFLVLSSHFANGLVFFSLDFLWKKSSEKTGKKIFGKNLVHFQSNRNEFERTCPLNKLFFCHFQYSLKSNYTNFSHFSLAQVFSQVFWALLEFFEENSFFVLIRNWNLFGTRILSLNRRIATKFWIIFEVLTPNTSNDSEMFSNIFCSFIMHASRLSYI